MGDRANIILTEQYDGAKASVYLYTHWNGSRIEQLAADGLRLAVAAGREGDAQYAGRIITDAFLAAHSDSPTMGAGVSALIGDGESHTVEINFTVGSVTVATWDGTETYPTVYDFLAAYPLVSA